MEGDKPTCGDRKAQSIARARQLARGDASIHKFCVLQPSQFIKQAPETRHAMLREAAELLLLSASQEILRSEVIDGKSATPNQNISFGTRWDKVFHASQDANSVTITLPKQALQALQIGIAIQVKPQPNRCEAR